MKTMHSLKKLVVLLLSVVMLSLPAAEAAAICAQAETTVYVTRTGSKYHAKKCGNGTYTASTLTAAKARGLTPCKKCFPNGAPSSSSGSSGSKKTKTTLKMALAKTSIVLLVDQTYTLKVKHAPGSVTWTSSKSSVATVKAGVVRGVSAGTATITASAKGQKKTCKVKVEAPQLSRETLDLDIGDVKQLKLKGCSHAATWHSTNEDAVFVDETGEIWAADAGRARVWTKVHGVKYICIVTVKDWDTD